MDGKELTVFEKLSWRTLPISKRAREVDNIIHYSLHQNYPNPFNPNTLIEYTLPQTAKVSIIIYNTVGEVVSTLVDELQSEGAHAVKFDVSMLPSCLYFYQMKTAGFNETKKMLLLK